MHISTGWADGRGPDAVDQFDRGAGVIDAEATAGQGFLIDTRVQVGKALGKLDFLAIDGDRAICAATAGSDRKRQILRIYGEVPVHLGMFQVKEAAHALGVGIMYFDCFRLSKQPDQQVEQVNTNVGGNATRFIGITFPGGMVPGAARRHIGEDYMVFVSEVGSC